MVTDSGVQSGAHTRAAPHPCASGECRGEKGQRDKGAKGQRDKGTKRKRSPSGSAPYSVTLPLCHFASSSSAPREEASQEVEEVLGVRVPIVVEVGVRAEERREE